MCLVGLIRFRAACKENTMIYFVCTNLSAFHYLATMLGLLSSKNLLTTIPVISPSLSKSISNVNIFSVRKTYCQYTMHLYLIWDSISAQIYCAQAAQSLLLWFGRMEELHLFIGQK